MFEELVEALVKQAQRASCEQARLLSCIREVARAAPVGEFAADEVAFALTWTRKAAEAHVALAYQLLDHMPEVFAALGTGVIDLPKARVDQLGLLCRHHHRLKREGRWEVHQAEPGVFTWLSPAGRIYRVGPEPP